MKNSFLALVLIVSASIFLANCNGNKGGSNAAPPPPVVTGMTGPGGCLQTARGCLPQGTCPPNYGMLGNIQSSECFPATGLNNMCDASMIMTQFGCLPQGGCPVGKASYGNSCVPGKTAYQMQYQPGYR